MINCRYEIIPVLIACLGNTFASPASAAQLMTNKLFARMLALSFAFFAIVLGAGSAQAGTTTEAIRERIAPALGAPRQVVDVTRGGREENTEFT
jgi:hypothetical protein